MIIRLILPLGLLLVACESAPPPSVRLNGSEWFVLGRQVPTHVVAIPSGPIRVETRFAGGANFSIVSCTTLSGDSRESSTSLVLDCPDRPLRIAIYTQDLGIVFDVVDIETPADAGVVPPDAGEFPCHILSAWYLAPGESYLSFGILKADGGTETRTIWVVLDRDCQLSVAPREGRFQTEVVRTSELGRDVLVSAVLSAPGLVLEDVVLLTTSLDEEAIAVRLETEPACPNLFGSCSRADIGDVFLVDRSSVLFRRSDSGQFVLAGTTWSIENGRRGSAQLSDVAIDSTGRLWGFKAGQVCEVGLENGLVRNCIFPGTGPVTAGAGHPDAGLFLVGTGLALVEPNSSDVLIQSGTFPAAKAAAWHNRSLYFVTSGLRGDELWMADGDGGVSLVFQYDFSSVDGLFSSGGLFAVTNSSRYLELLPDGGVADSFLDGIWTGAASHPAE